MNLEDFRQITILYAEDDPGIRNSLITAFNKIFKEVIVAEDGVIGVKKFQEARNEGKHIDIILTDIRMPNMTGIEMLREVRKFDKEVPAIVLSAFNENVYIMEAKTLGVEHYLLKPFKVMEIINEIKKVLSN